MSAGMTAEAIGRAARYDMQLLVPQRPTVRRGVRLRAQDDQVALEGAHRSQVFSGEFASTHLIGLVALCDGTRDLTGLAAESGHTEDVVFKALALLWTAGVLEEHDDGEADGLTRITPEHACLLSRLGDSTGANPSWVTAVQRLTGTPIVLRGDRTVIDRIVPLLAPMRVLPNDGPDADTALTVYVETDGSAAGLGAVAQECWDAGRPLLRVRLSGDELLVGPYVDPDFTACYECGSSDGRLEPPGSHVGLAAGLVARELHAFIGRAVHSSLPVDSHRVDLHELTVTYAPHVARPGCPRCAYSTGPVAATPPVGAVYEQAVAIPPRRFVGEKGHQAHYKSSNLQLQYEFREWPGCPRQVLPPPDLGRLAVPWDAAVPVRDGCPDLADLGTVLAIACGLRPGTQDYGKLRRWTAAGGNIGSVTAFLAVRDPALLEPGTYVYLERDHALARVCDEVPPGAAPVDLAFTGNAAKVARKYMAFALRIVIQDTGCSLGAAQAVAGALGISFRPVADWDEQAWRGACTTDPGREPLTAVVALGGVTDAI